MFSTQFKHILSIQEQKEFNKKNIQNLLEAGVLPITLPWLILKIVEMILMHLQPMQILHEQIENIVP
jgi:hypothetical protein